MATPLTQKFPCDKDKLTFLKKSQTLQLNHNDRNLDDFYHIKQCYQSVPKTKPPRRGPYRPSTGTPHQHNCNATTTTSTTPVPSCLPPLLHFYCRLACCASTSLQLMWRRWLIVACILLLHATTRTMAAPQSCILCDKNDLIAKDPQTNYEEFLFEHQVTRQDAINALKQLNESFYDGLQADSSCNAVRCTEKVNKYCLGPQFINDHCYCEYGHSTEGLPFVPHMCYVGEKVYKPSVGSCFFYEEVKQCCCSSLLAREWRHISSSSSLHRNSTTIYCSSNILLITFLYLLIRRLHY